jgi:hypothetical protein
MASALNELVTSPTTPKDVLTQRRRGLGDKSLRACPCGDGHNYMENYDRN